MSANNYPILDKVLWRDVRKDVINAYPELAEVIDSFNPTDEFILYKVRYPFGSTIVKAGKLHVPFQNSLIPIDDPRIPEEIHAHLGYNAGTIPAGVVLNQAIEPYFIQPEGKVTPYAVMRKGKIFALSVALKKNISHTIPKAWHIIAGSRCLFMLPRITDTVLYKKLCKARGIKLPMPRKLFDHGPIMTQISQHKEFNSLWHTELLFFPAIWLTPRKAKNWIAFHHFLYEDAWDAMNYWQNKVVHDYVWDCFIKDLSLHKTRILPHIIDIVKHLIMLGLGILPGFCPAINEEQAPIEALKHDFINCYELERFAPTIMVPKHFSLEDKRPVYYSLQMPTHFDSSPKPRTVSSTLSDLRETYVLLNDFYNAVLDSKLEVVNDTPIEYLVKHIRYDFFHSEPDPEGIIRLSREIPEEDKTFINSSNKFGRRGFSEVSPFTRGCIRISVTSEKN